jgi:predicted PurR-regulated permease PerM
LLILSKKYISCLRAAKVVSVVVTAAACTVCFTLFDDLLYPLFYGGWGNAAVTYFYASFTAMLPQTVCTVATVALLFLPLTKIFAKAAKSIEK